MKNYFNYRSWIVMFFIILIAVVISTFIVVLEFSNNVKNAMAGAGHNVTGYAWSELYGWVSFNSANPGAGGLDYGVNIDENRNFSGYAWSPNIGWISFQEKVNVPDYNFDLNCPNLCDASNSCTACLGDDNKIYGWAKVLAFGSDGWISLGDESPSMIPEYGVEKVGIDFKGWAWGGPVGIGWLSFNCLDLEEKELGSCTDVGGSNYKVSYAGDNPTVEVKYKTASFDENFDEVFFDTCADEPILGATLSWYYNKDKPSLPDQAKYNIVIRDSLGEIDYPGTKEWIENGATVFQFIKTSETEHPKFGETYTWTIQAEDTAGLVSNIDKGTIAFYKHPFPIVDFDFTPPNPTYNEDVFIFDDCALSDHCSQVFDLPGDPNTPNPTGPSAWLWTPGGDNSTGSSTTIHLETDIELTLRVTDSDKYSCEKTIDMPPKSSPIWIEVKPR